MLEGLELLGKLRDGKARIGVIGETVNAGRSHIDDIDASRVMALVTAGRLTATSDYALLADADAAVIAVPTPIDVHRVPDLRFVMAASNRLAETMRRGSLVCLESTTYPGTTEEILAAAFRQAGKVPGLDVHIAYSPERIDPGNPVWRLDNTPKLVAGLTPECLEIALAFYGRFVERPVPVSSLRTAELAKLFENIFRVVNIALVNELQVICDGFDIDVWELIEACSTKPFGFMPFYPGPGLGGHCVPVDPFYLAWKARERDVNTEFIELAGRVNASMPRYVVGKVTEMLNAGGKSIQGAAVLILGVAYKRNTSDLRESPALRIIELLNRTGALVSYHDPHVPQIDVGGEELRSIELDARSISAHDAVLVVADHDAIDWAVVEQHATRLLDTRNVIRRKRGQAPSTASSLSASRGIV